MHQALKPYFLLACVAFVLGFTSYLAVGSVFTVQAPVPDEWQASIPVPADAPLAKAKHI
jgi:hypothetical protein